jgi:predicted  nucleic acid-binding Zn-ribbon protein
MLGPSERRKLAEMSEEGSEAEVQFVSYITDSLLARLTGTSDFSQVKYLRISESDAKLKFIESMDRVPNLEELDLSDNEITQIRGLLPLKRLKILNLSTNLITLIEGMDSLARLEELDLSGNQIERIPASMAKLISLKILKLHNNKLGTLHDLSHLRSLKNLSSLTIFSNPMSEAEHSRNYAIYALPSLSTLDDAPVEDDERAASHARFHREEIELLEQQLSKARTEIKSAKDAISKLESVNMGTRSSESRLGHDVSSLSKRIAQLESENVAKTELLNKKSAELVGLCELLYEMKQELAFANIDKQFDMSAVDSIIEGDHLNGDDLEMADLDAQFEQLEMNDDMATSSAGGVYSPALRGSGSDTLSPLPFAHSGIAQEFREMPYIGKTSATPTRPRTSSRPGSRAPNGAIVVQSRKQIFETAAETQQAAHRYRTVKQQYDALELEGQALDATIQDQTKILDEMRSRLDSKIQFVNSHPDDAESFAMHIEIETLRQEVALQNNLVQKMMDKRGELSKRIEPLQIEAEQMKSLLGDLDDDTINSAHDFAMEIKALETQLEDRDETIQRMHNLLSQKGLLSELDKTVHLRPVYGEDKGSHASSPPLPTSSHTHSEHHTHSFTSEDVLAKLREMELNHIEHVKRLISGFPKYPTESATQYAEVEPRSVEEACHTLQQQISDAFGFSYGGKWLTASVASLRERIVQLESHVEYLEHLKYTHFFNIEDGLDEDMLTLAAADVATEGSLPNSFTGEPSSQEILFALPKTVEGVGDDEDDKDDDDAEEINRKGSGRTYGVRREKLEHSTLKQLWFLWRLLSMKMESVRKSWENGAISNSAMGKITESGEWKYWSGMGRLEFFFQHAMSHISVLEGQVAGLQQQLVAPRSLQGSDASSGVTPAHVEPLAAERDSLLAEITSVSEELAMKQADVHVLREEISELRVQQSENSAVTAALVQAKADLDALQAQRERGEVELEYLKSQIEQQRVKREEVEALQTEFNRLRHLVDEANHAREEMNFAKREHARITIEIAATQRLRDELDALKSEIAGTKATLNGSAPPKASINSNTPSKVSQPAEKQKPVPIHARAVSTTGAMPSPSQTVTPATTPAKTSTTLTRANTTTPTKSERQVSIKEESASSAPAANMSASSLPSTTTTTTTAAVNNASIPVTRQADSDMPPSTPNSLTPSSSTSSLKDASVGGDMASVDSSVTDRLSAYRQKEQEARKLKEEQEMAKSKRAPPKRSWTVAETVGLARSGAGPENPRSTVMPSSSVTHLPSPLHSAPVSSVSSPGPLPSENTSTSIVEEPVIKDFLPDDVRRERRKSQLPRGLQDFLKMTGGPQ